MGQSTTGINDITGRPVSVIDNVGQIMTYAYAYTTGNIEVKTVTDYLGNAIVTHTDVRDNKRYMNDPDMGIWTYDYNSLGELTKQTDARGVITTMGYDVLGRLATRTDFATGSVTVAGLTTQTRIIP